MFVLDQRWDRLVSYLWCWCMAGHIWSPAGRLIEAVAYLSVQGWTDIIIVLPLLKFPSFWGSCYRELRWWSSLYTLCSSLRSPIYDVLYSKNVKLCKPIEVINVEYICIVLGGMAGANAFSWKRFILCLWGTLNCLYAA